MDKSSESTAQENHVLLREYFLDLNSDLFRWFLSWKIGNNAFLGVIINHLQFKIMNPIRENDEKNKENHAERIAYPTLEQKAEQLLL